jgi:hypothetical protein
LEELTGRSWAYKSVNIGRHQAVGVLVTISRFRAGRASAAALEKLIGQYQEGWTIAELRDPDGPRPPSKPDSDPEPKKSKKGEGKPASKAKPEPEAKPTPEPEEKPKAESKPKAPMKSQALEPRRKTKPGPELLEFFKPLPIFRFVLWLLRAMDKDEISGLNKVRLEWGYMVTTDGHRLHCLDVSDFVDAEAEGVYEVLSQGKDRVILKRLPEGEHYPNWWDVLPKTAAKKEIRIYVDPDAKKTRGETLISSAYSEIARLLKQGCVNLRYALDMFCGEFRVGFYGEGQPLTFVSPDLAQVGLIMPMRG